MKAIAKRGVATSWTSVVMLALALCLACVAITMALVPCMQAYAGEKATDGADASPSLGTLQAQSLVVPQADTYSTAWYYTKGPNNNNQGPDSNAFTIDSALDLNGLAYLVNTKNETFAGKTITLSQDIAYTTIPLDPIGTAEHPFDGTFNGGNHTISNLKLNVGNRLSYIGMFGYVADENATIDKPAIKNLTLDGGAIAVTNTAAGKTIQYVGAIAGYLDGDMENCSSTAALTITNNGAVPTKKGTTPEELCTITNIGGLVGRLAGDLVNCTHGNATLSINSTTGVTENVPYIAGFVGGLVGFQGIEDDATHVTSTRACTNAGKLSFNVSGIGLPDRFGNKAYAKSVMVGGVVGYSMGNFVLCKNTAQIQTGLLDSGGAPKTQFGAVTCGGIVGSLRGPTIVESTSQTGVVGADSTDPGYTVWTKSDGATEPQTLTIEKCENTAYIVGLASLGGIAGSTGAFTRIAGCVNSGDIDGTRQTKPCPAGIVGITNGDVSYCANTGNIRTTTGAGYYASGIAGLLTTYNTSRTKLNLVLAPPEIYGCYITGQIESSAGGGYRSAVIAGESDGNIHDNCYLANLSSDKNIPADWAVVLDYISSGDGAIDDGHVVDVQALIDRVNTLEIAAGVLKEKNKFTITGNKLDQKKSSLESRCKRSQLVEKDQDRGTLARNHELTVAELKGSMGISFLNRMNGVRYAWGENDYYFKKSASGGFPLLSWQEGGVSGTISLTGAVVEEVSNPEYSSACVPVPSLAVTMGGELLYQNADYRVKPQDNAKTVNAGTEGKYEANIEGMNEYKDGLSGIQYQVAKCNVDNCKVKATPKTFNWNVQSPSTVYLIDDSGNSILVDDSPNGTHDFYWSKPVPPAGADLTGEKPTDGKYYDYKNVHGATYQYDLVIQAKDSSENYYGSTRQPAFHINWASLVYDDESGEDDGNREETAKFDKVVYKGQSWDFAAALKTKGLVKIKYTGSPIEPTVKNPTYLGRALRNGTGQKYWEHPNWYDFRYVYGNPNPISGSAMGKDCVNATGSDASNLACMTIRFTQNGNFDNYSNVFFEITPASLSSDVLVRGAGGSYLYTGSPQKPLTLVYNGMTLREGVDYAVTYLNNTNMGIATATFTGRGNYTGSTTQTFMIAQNPALIEQASNVNASKVTPDQIKRASDLGATNITLGAKVKTIAKNSFAGTSIRSITVTSKKLTKNSVKDALKGSGVVTIKVQIKPLKSTKGLKGKALKKAKKYNKDAQKLNKQYVKKYKKIFTKKICGKKVKVTT